MTESFNSQLGQELKAAVTLTTVCDPLSEWLNHLSSLTSVSLSAKWELIMLPYWDHRGGRIDCSTFPRMIQPGTIKHYQPSAPQRVEGQTLARTLRVIERGLQVRVRGVPG